jgi:nucleotide-binding universal stress UspA family protein
MTTDVLHSTTRSSSGALRDTVQVSFFETRVVDGDPATAIMELADEVDAAMVAIGRRGRGGLAELVLGSAPRRLIPHCEHPVLMVPAR